MRVQCDVKGWAVPRRRSLGGTAVRHREKGGVCIKIGLLALVHVKEFYLSVDNDTLDAWRHSLLLENQFCCKVKDVWEERDLSSQKKTSQKSFVKVLKLRKRA